MKKQLFVVLVLLAGLVGSQPAFAVEGSEVQLRSSTVPGMTVGAVGLFEITSPDKIVFRAAGNPEIAMPYAQITEFSYRTEVTHHLGVVGAIVVGLIKKRERQHFLTITYREHDAVQMASFEVSKKMPDVLVSLLRSKAKSACERGEYGRCFPVVAQSSAREATVPVRSAP